MSPAYIGMTQVPILARAIDQGRSVERLDEKGPVAETPVQCGNQQSLLRADLIELGTQVNE